jgi:hypothetical protein
MTEGWKQAAHEAWHAPSWCEAAVKYREERPDTGIAPDRLRRLRALMNSGTSLEHASFETHRHHFSGRTAASTVEALLLGLRERGVAALKEAKVLRRLSELSDEQLTEVGGRLQRLKPNIAPAWSADEIETLFTAREALRK